jgi:hypothetical protein
MGERSMTVRRFEEIRRRLSEGRGLREIARALSCSRDTVREVRDGLRVSPDAPKSLRNSRGVTYSQMAVLEGAVLKVFGSDGFTQLWNSRCVHESGQDVTSDVNDVNRR